MRGKWQELAQIRCSGRHLSL